MMAISVRSTVCRSPGNWGMGMLTTWSRFRADRLTDSLPLGCFVWASVVTRSNNGLGVMAIHMLAMMTLMRLYALRLAVIVGLWVAIRMVT